MVQSVPALVNWKPEGALEIGQHMSICSFKIQTKIKKAGRGVRGLGYKTHHNYYS